jgi:hypothetical protein
MMSFKHRNRIFLVEMFDFYVYRDHLGEAYIGAGMSKMEKHCYGVTTSPESAAYL